MDQERQILERQAASGDTQAQAKLDMMKTRMGERGAPEMPPAKPMVRTRSPYSGCDVLGELVKETVAFYFFRAPENPLAASNGWPTPMVVKRISKTKKARHAGFPHPAPHVDPCTSCRDHPSTPYTDKACLHGTEGFCERCASM